jgi:hypothetical protein
MKASSYNGDVAKESHSGRWSKKYIGPDVVLSESVISIFNTAASKKNLSTLHVTTLPNERCNNFSSMKKYF